MSSKRHTNAISFANTLKKQQAGEATKSCKSDDGDKVIIAEKNKKDLESIDPCGAIELLPQLPKKDRKNLQV